jgi:hypothetical protein
MRLVCGRPAYSTLATPDGPAIFFGWDEIDNEINHMMGFLRLGSC